MKRSTKRLVGLLIALCLIVGLLPAAALAVDGGTNDPEAPTGTLVITKTFTFVDDEKQPNPIAPDPTLLESFEMTVTEEMLQKGETAEAADVPTVTYDAEEGKFIASAGTITQLTEGVGYVWTLERTPGNYLIEESGIFGYRFLGNTWSFGDDVVSDALSCAVVVPDGKTLSVAVTNSYQRRYGDIVLSKIIRGITYEDFLKTGATFTLEGPPDFNGGEPMTFAFNSDFSGHYVTQDEIREAHRGIEGYNLLEPVEHVPFGVYTVTEEHADFAPYHLTVSYGDGGYNDYIYILKKAAGPAINDEKAAGEWDEFGYPPYQENQFVVGTLYEHDEYLTSGRIVIDTYTAECDLKITKVFRGLETGVYPDRFSMGLLPAEMFEDNGGDEGDYRKDYEEPIIFDVGYDAELGRFVLGETNGYDVRIEQTRNGFVWTLTDIPAGDYFLAEMPGWVQGYKWTGLTTNGLTKDELEAAEEIQDVPFLPVGEVKLQPNVQPNASRQIKVTNNYEPAYGYLKVTKELDLKNGSAQVTIPDGTTFTVRDYNGNVVKDADGNDAVLTYADILAEDYLLELPTGEYYVEETNAEVEDYVVTARTEIYDPFAVVLEPIDPPAQERSADGNAKSTSVVHAYGDFYVDEEHDEDHPIEVRFFNRYTPESECGTLTLTKQVYGLEELDDGYSVCFEINSSGFGSIIEMDADSFEEKEDEYGDVYFESVIERKLPCDGQYYVSEFDGEVDYYYHDVRVNGSYSYGRYFTISAPTDSEDVTFSNYYWKRDDVGSLSIFTQINPTKLERSLSGNFGFEITGPEGFGENGKMTVAFSDMVPVTEDEYLDEFVDYYSADFLNQGNWYVYSLYSYPQAQKSRSYNEQNQGYEFTEMPAGEYTVREVNMDISGYWRTTEPLKGYFKHDHIEVVRDVEALQKRASDTTVLTVEVAKDYETYDAYAAFINNYEKGGIGGGDDPEPPPTLNTEDHFDYIQGYPDGLVRPEGNITRAEVATIFFRLLKDEVREEYLAETNDFSDVEEGRWYNKAISTLANMGILRGYTDGTFKPDGMITRAEFATIAAAFDDRADVPDADFSDLSGHWAALEVSLAAANGWVNGYPDGTFGPDSLITRAEAMAIVNRVLNRCPASTDDLLDGMITWPDNADTSKWYYLDVQEATNSHEYTRAGERETWTKLLPKRDWLEIEQSQTA